MSLVVTTFLLMYTNATCSSIVYDKVYDGASGGGALGGGKGPTAGATGRAFALGSGGGMGGSGGLQGQRLNPCHVVCTPRTSLGAPSI